VIVRVRTSMLPTLTHDHPKSGRTHEVPRCYETSSHRCAMQYSRSLSLDQSEALPAAYNIGRIAELVSAQAPDSGKGSRETRRPEYRAQSGSSPAGSRLQQASPGAVAASPSVSRDPGAQTMSCRSPCFFRLDSAQSSSAVQYGETPDSGRILT
jgi:hypothetical protein